MGVFCLEINDLLDWTRRAWVAPDRDGRYVLGRLEWTSDRSRTALFEWSRNKKKSIFLGSRQIVPSQIRSFFRQLFGTPRAVRRYYGMKPMLLWMGKITFFPDGHLIVWNSGFWIRSASAALRRNKFMNDFENQLQLNISNTRFHFEMILKIEIHW